MEKNNDKKVLKIYNILLIINLIVFAAVTIVMALVVPFPNIKMRIFVTLGVLLGLILISSFFDILIIKRYTKKYKVM